MHTNSKQTESTPSETTWRMMLVSVACDKEAHKYMPAAHIYQLMALASVVLIMLVSSLNYSTMTAAAGWVTETSQTENIAWD